MYNLGLALWSFEVVLPDLCDGWIWQMQCLAKQHVSGGSWQMPL